MMIAGERNVSEVTTRRIRYVTLFPECESVHLKKDVGMLPYCLGKYRGYSFQLVCYEKECFTESEKQRYNLALLKNKAGPVRDFAGYILNEGRNIDVLNLYHISSRRNALWILLYKLVNPSGIVHMKLDADYRMLEVVDMYPRSLKGKIRAGLFRKLVDLYTVESEKMLHLLSNEWQLPMKLLPNGVFLNHESDLPSAEEKEKIFLTVGRLGTEQKATEDLLCAFARIADQVDWKLWLAGSIEPEFEAYIQSFFNQNPSLKPRIRFWGNISDQSKLETIYSKASVFVLPSKWESFGLVILEALEKGAYLILSDKIPPAEEICGNGYFGTVVPYGDVEQLAQTMLRAASRKFADVEIKERHQWVIDRFSWEVIAGKLDQYIREVRSRRGRK